MGGRFLGELEPPLRLRRPSWRASRRARARRRWWRRERRENTSSGVSSWGDGGTAVGFGPGLAKPNLLIGGLSNRGYPGDMPRSAGTPARTRLAPDERRAQIVAAARGLFAARPFHDVSIADATKRARTGGLFLDDLEVIDLGAR